MIRNNINMDVFREKGVWTPSTILDLMWMDTHTARRFFFFSNSSLTWFFELYVFFPYSLFTLPMIDDDDEIFLSSILLKEPSPSVLGTVHTYSSAQRAHKHTNTQSYWILYDTHYKNVHALLYSFICGYISFRFRGQINRECEPGVQLDTWPPVWNCVYELSIICHGFPVDCCDGSRLAERTKSFSLFLTWLGITVK